eukprot:1721950-Pleurochrysis_carterae.AAC.1
MSAAYRLASARESAEHHGRLPSSAVNNGTSLRTPRRAARRKRRWGLRPADRCGSAGARASAPLCAAPSGP